MMPLRVLLFVLLFNVPNLISAQCNQLRVVPDKAFVCGSGLFKFELSGAQNAKAVFWDFGKGFRQGGDTLFEFFNQPGKIDLRVRIIWNDGSNCTADFDEIAEVKALPSTAFTLSRTKLCDGPDTVSFTSIAKHLARVSWIIDGTNYFNQGQHIVHQFTSSGKKDFTIIVHDSLGCRGIKEVEDAVIVYEDVEVDFSSNTRSGCAPKQLHFTPQVKANGNTISNWNWNFEGSTEKQSFVNTPDTINYPNPGAFDVALELVTSSGCKHELTKEDYITIGDSVPIHLNLNKSYYCLEDEIILHDQFRKEDGEYHWILPSETEYVKSQGEAIRKLKFKKPGLYSFTVQYENNGCVSQKEFKDALRVHEVKARFSSNNSYHCTPPLSVDIKNQTTSTDSGNLFYNWKIKKGKQVLRMSSNRDLSMFFSDWGYFDAELIAVHQNGCRDTLISRDFIRIDTIRPKFSAEPPIACIGQEITFRNGTYRSTYVGQDTFYWVFYDKNGVDILGTSREREPTFTYQDSGFYPVALYAGNPVGCDKKLMEPRAVEIIKPVLNPKVNPQIVCSGDSIRLKQATTPDHAPLKHHWYFANRFKSQSYEYTTEDTSVVISETGPYDLIYSIDLKGGCRDTMILPKVLSINGLDIDVVTDKTSDCLPMVLEAQSRVLANFHDGSDDKSIKFNWETFHTDIQVENQQSYNPEFTIFRNGIYFFEVEATNSTGCKARVRTESIYAGVDSRISISDQRVCVGDQIGASSASQLRPTDFWWTTPQTEVDIANPTNSGSSIQANSEGVYRLYLITGKNNKCFDTSLVEFEAIEVKASFHALDTELTCAPVYAQFASESKNADELIWNFGDGQDYVTILPDAAHVYYQNSGWSDGFDVSLIAKSHEGCSDTLVKEDYLWVKGPVPKMEVSNLKGCEPLQLQVTNQSKDAVRYLLEFGDNGLLDSSDLGPHTYVLTKSFLDTQYFEPVLFAYDSLGCVAKFNPDTLVMVKRTPVIEKTLAPSTGCEPLDMGYREYSRNISNRKWVIRNEQHEILEDSSHYGSFLFRDHGKYTVHLSLTNEQACSNESVDTVVVHASPNAAFSFTDSVCFGQTYNFQSQSSIAQGQIDSFGWKLTSINLTQKELSGEKMQIHFNESGDFTLEHHAISAHGCEDSMSVSVHVPHPDEIPVPHIKKVSFQDNQLVSMDINSNHYYRAVGFRLRKNDMPILSVNDPDQSEFRELPVMINGTDQCYDLSRKDFCGYESDFATSHCPVILKAQSTTSFTVQLNWTAYKGWPEVSAYRIYRKTSEGNNNFELLNELAGDVLSFVDSPLCQQTYEYKLVAIKANELLESHSNTVSIEPKYDVTPFRTNVRSVSVVSNDEAIEVKWNKSIDARFDHYILSKSLLKSNGQEEPQELFELKDTFFRDDQVLPDHARYVYRISEKDICGLENEAGLPGISVLLSGSYQNYNAHLSWTPYGQWSKGIKSYELQINVPSKGFVPVKQVSGVTTETSDSKVYPEIQEDYCYRVLAISNEQKPDSSFSNTLCLNGESNLLVPNAFTPNGDGRNDIFKPVSIFGYNQTDNSFKMYRFEIFNRWGEKIFETNDISEGWDGTYQGMNSPGGVYMYQIRFFGLDHTIHESEGSITLIR